MYILKIYSTLSLLNNLKKKHTKLCLDNPPKIMFNLRFRIVCFQMDFFNADRFFKNDCLINLLLGTIL